SPMSVNDAVREIVLLLEAEARQADVTVDLELRDGLPEAAADFLQVQQVVQHLVRNGLEAMADVPPDQRRLTVATERTQAGRGEGGGRSRGRHSRPRSGAGGSFHRTLIRAVFYQQIERTGFGAVDQPDDRRSPRRTDLDNPKCHTRSNGPIYTAGRIAERESM